MFLSEAIEGASECVFAQMLLPANNRMEALKLVSPLEREGKSASGVFGFKIFMNL